MNRGNDKENKGKAGKGKAGKGHKDEPASTGMIMGFFKALWRGKEQQQENRGSSTEPKLESKSEACLPAVTVHTDHRPVRAVSAPPEEIKPPSRVIVKLIKENSFIDLADQTRIEIKQTDAQNFWICNPSKEEVQIASYSLVTGDQKVSPDFELLPPSELVFGTVTEKTDQNTFSIRFTPPKESVLLEATVTFKFLFMTSKLEKTFSIMVFGQGTFRQKPDQTEMSPAKDLRHTSFPLRFIPDKWHLAVDSLLNPDSDDLEMSMGLHAGLVALKELYYMNSETWREVRDKVIVSLVKATGDCGNTSVSMGLACTFFHNNPGARFAGFLNCGTGGVRFQLYLRHTKDGETCCCIAESKPGTGALSRLGGIANTNYHPPSGKAPQSLEEVSEELAQGIKHAPWNDRSERGVRKLIEAELGIKVEDEEIYVFAFITGSIRNYYYKSDHETKEELDNAMTQLLGEYAQPVSDLLQQRFSEEAQGPVSFFISQKREGEMEFVGACTMQKAVDEKCDRTGLRPNEPIACLGIGTGSSQLTIAKPEGRKNQQYRVLEFDKGMQALQGLLTLGREFVQNPGVQDLVAAAQAADRKGRIPMILLKSGCLIRLWEKDYDGEREQLTKLAQTKFWLDECAGTSKQSYHPMPGSVTVSRLCAEVTKSLNSEVDLVAVYRAGKREGDTAACSEFKEGDACSYEGLPSHVWWWPEKERSPLRGHIPQIDPYAKLLIHLPFNLLKEFLPSRKKKATALNHFKDLLQMHFTRNTHQKPTSFECICKVYRLLYELKGNTNRETAYDFYDFAANFVDQTPEYDEEQATAFRQLRPYLAVSSIVGELINQRPTLAQDKNLVDLNRRVAEVLLDDFRRALQAVCNSPFLKNYRDITSEANVKSKDSVTRKLKSPTTGPPETIVDYLRGTIYVGRNTEEAVNQFRIRPGFDLATLTTAVLADQVENILRAINAMDIPIKRIKLEYMEKGRGFILLNVEFKLNDNLKHICEIQIRLKPLECSATPDDHLKHEVDRTFGSCLDCGTPLDRACIDFFAVPCKTAFQPFFETQMVTLKQTPSGIEIEQREPGKPEGKEEAKKTEPKEAKETTRTFTDNWIEQLKRYQKFVRSAWWDEEIMVTKVFFPSYAVKKERATFYKGVKFGFQFLQEAIQKRGEFVGKNQYVIARAVVLYFAKKLDKLRSDLMQCALYEFPERLPRVHSSAASLSSLPPTSPALTTWPSNGSGLTTPARLHVGRSTPNAPNSASPPSILNTATPNGFSAVRANIAQFNALGTSASSNSSSAASANSTPITSQSPAAFPVSSDIPGPLQMLFTQTSSSGLSEEILRAMHELATEWRLGANLPDNAQMYWEWAGIKLNEMEFVESNFAGAIAATRTNYVMGIMSAFRYCRRGRLGVLMKGDADKITIALEADVSTRLIFGVLDAMHTLADTVQPEWVSKSTKPTLNKQPSSLLKADTQSQIHAFAAHQKLAAEKPPLTSS